MVKYPLAVQDRWLQIAEYLTRIANRRILPWSEYLADPTEEEAELDDEKVPTFVTARPKGDRNVLDCMVVRGRIIEPDAQGLTNLCPILCDHK